MALSGMGTGVGHPRPAGIPVADRCLVPQNVAGGVTPWLRCVVNGAADIDVYSAVAAGSYGEFLFKLGRRDVLAGGGVGACGGSPIGARFYAAAPCRVRLSFR